MKMLHTAACACRAARAAFIGTVGTLLGLLAAQVGCNPNKPVHIGEFTGPHVALSLSDTLITASEGLRFSVAASDNISLWRVGWSVSGVVERDSTITFSAPTISYFEEFAVTDGLTAGALLIVATAVDSHGQEAVPDSARVTVVAP